METDVIIDELTECLEETSTGKKVDTEWRQKQKPVTLKDNKGWKFKWNILSKKYRTYELFVKGDTTVQGRIALFDGEDHIEIQNIETAHTIMDTTENIKELAVTYSRLPVN